MIEEERGIALLQIAALDLALKRAWGSSDTARPDAGAHLYGFRELLRADHFSVCED